MHPLMSNKGGSAREGWGVLAFLTSHVVIPVVILLDLCLEAG